MSLKEFIQTNPTREKVADILCKTANTNHLNIKDLWCYKELCNKYQLSDDNFYEDKNELSDYEMYCVGLYNWKYRL